MSWNRCDSRSVRVAQVRSNSASAGCFGPGAESCTLADCMDAFSEEEQLDGDEKYFCDRCKQHQPATKWLRVHQYPKVDRWPTSVNLEPLEKRSSELSALRRRCWCCI